MSQPQKLDQVILALDLHDLEAAAKLLENLKGTLTYYKIGFEFFTMYGWKAVELVNQSGGRIFLDLKLHDIPTTVAKTATVICQYGIDMFNVHTLGGLEMMKKTREAVDLAIQDPQRRPKVLGVTILTSHSQETLSDELGITGGLQDRVLALARLAHKAGLDGVVCSPQELALLRKEMPSDFLLVTPGIRPEGSAMGDQKRTLTPKEALEQGASYIVIGRPVTAAPNPRSAVEALIAAL